MEEKTLQMIKSNDPELRNLAIILCIEKGEDWCLKNLPRFGHLGNGKENPDAIKFRCCADDGVAYIIGESAIVIRSGYLQCRKISEFKKSSFLQYKICYDNGRS